ncbi:MAG TPA: CHRD domain-containing protein, partial [Flavisolibacter sp.]|nr:CHRD domain-containing protein [Flavisolibacter sp.]
MKRFYLNVLLPEQKRLLFLLVCLAAGLVSFGQVYTTQLSGPNEQPPNASPGTGMARVTLSGTMMRVEVQFSGLLGTTVASHIHAPTPGPGSGAAGVATTTPTFPNFPLGVTAGSYDRTFDMLLPSSYNPAYLSANGGSPAAAFAALKAAMDAGRSYLNVHSNVFPGGEIRGFLTPCAAITVSIPDAFALDKGVLPNTVYPVYAPASHLLLKTSVSGGTGPYTFRWSTGGTTESLTVSPTVNTLYSVQVTDKNGCPGMASKTVQVVDVAGGNKGDKIEVCHKGQNSLVIAAPAVASHLEHGDMLGGCTEQALTVRGAVVEEAVNRFAVKAGPNPWRNAFHLQLGGQAGSRAEVKVYDALGRVV